MTESLIPPHGGYRKLKSFQIAQLIYDVTVRFCDRFIDKKSRTHDQMVQAARSGVQNIAEGSQCSGTSKKFEIKLTSVARASLEELRLDYEDFLRQHKLEIWSKNNPLKQELIDARCKNADDLARWVKKKVKETGQSGQDGLVGESRKSKESTLSTETIAANSALVLIAVASSLLDRQIARLAEDFEKEGGFTERMHRIRTSRKKQINLKSRVESSLYSSEKISTWKVLIWVEMSL